MLYQKITWTVQHGNKLGRSIGFPTANISIWCLLIEPGTYKCNIIHWEKIYSWIGSYKINTTIFEVHIFDFSENIYDENITIIPIYFLRRNRKFEHINDLKKQIELDRQEAVKKDIKVATFGTFDIVHPWHHYYLWEAKKYWDSLTTIIATDENVEKFKWIAPHHSIQKRISDIQNFWLSNNVVAGSNTSPLSWIEEYDTDVVCLWYDQKWFSQMLETYIEQRDSYIKVIRIPAYEEKKYKSSLLKKK